LSKEINIGEFESKLIKKYIDKIAERKKQKVLRFFNDYFMFMESMCKVANNYVVMTLGNRTVDGINIDLTNITMKYLEKAGFIREQKIARDIMIVNFRIKCN
jgi:hypothetical protein